MHTIHLPEELVVSYLRDLASRLRVFPITPLVWASVGGSGALIAKRLAKHAPDLYRKADELIIAYNRTTDELTYPYEKAPASLVRGRPVLILDDIVRSGKTLMRIASAISSFRPSAISSYAIAVHRSSQVVPNHFGFLTEDHDRVLCLRHPYQNSRLVPFGCLRKLSSSDCRRRMVKTGEKFIDKVAWEDRWYEVSTDAKRVVYVFEGLDRIQGFVSFRYVDASTMLIDELGTDEAFQKRGIAGCLLRWAEHCARHADCSRIELRGVETRVGWYQDKGFHKVRGEKPLRLCGKRFYRMTKPVVYNVPAFEGD